MFKCSTCQKEKPREEFYKKTKTLYRSDCKGCHKEKTRPRSQKHYENNKAYYRKRNNNKRRRHLARLVKEYKLTHPTCTDCKLDHPFYRLDFDHLPGSGKAIDLGRISTTGWSDTRVMEEIAKCELVCANCHRDRTFRRSRADSNDSYPGHHPRRATCTPREH